MQQLPGIHVDRGLESGHLRHIQFRPLVCIREKDHAFGMVGQVGDAVRCEIGQDRNDDRLIGIHGQVDDTPAGAVAGTQGDLLSLFDTSLPEKEVEPFDLPGHVGVGEGFTTDIVQGRFVPVFPGCSLQAFQIMRIVFHDRVGIRSDKNKDFFPFMYYLCT